MGDAAQQDHKDVDRLTGELAKCEEEVQMLRAGLARAQEGLAERDVALAAVGAALSTLLADYGVVGWKPVVWVGEPGSSATSDTGFIAAAQAKAALAAPALSRAVALDRARREYVDACRLWFGRQVVGVLDTRLIEKLISANEALRALEAETDAEPTT